MNLFIEVLTLLFKIGVLGFGMLILGIMVEKMLHFDDTMYDVTLHFKKDISDIFRALFGKEKARHIFDITLYEELKKVAEPYRNQAFETVTDVYNGIGTPYIAIILVPQRHYDIQELQELTNLELLKFRDYLRIRGEDFKVFGVYKKLKQRVCIILYYAELKKDYEYFDVQFERAIMEESTAEYGMIFDEELSKEIENAN